MTEPGNPSIKICELAELTDGEAVTVEAGGHALAVARIGDAVYAIDDTCTHAKVSLGEGIVDADDCTIECPKHGAVFSLVDGEALTLPATRGVLHHAVEIRDDGVYVDVRRPDDE